MNQAMLTPPPHPGYPVEAELQFLPAGHFLYRRYTKDGIATKFVTAADAAAAFTGAEMDTGWMPIGIVRSGSCKRGIYAVYTAPPQIVSITLTTSGDPKIINIPIPATILVGVKTTYYIAVLPDGEFSPKAITAYAPFPNVYQDGTICWGAKNTPKPARPGNMPDVWKKFFDVPFTSELATGKSKRFGDDVRERLIALNGKRKYPLADLILTGNTVRHWVKNILGGEEQADDD